MGILNFAGSKIVPAVFREFLPYVSKAGLRAIYKEQVLSLAISAAAKTLSTTSVEDAFKQVESSLRNQALLDRIQPMKGLIHPTDTSLLPEEERVKMGEAILTLYFHLIASPAPLFLDLRLHHFGWDTEKQLLKWTPSKLSYKRSAEFSALTRDLYEGFFLSRPEATERGLRLCAWKSEATAGFSGRMEALMRRHFGDVTSQSVRFSIQHFKETFHLVFEESIRSHSRLHPELAMLGTCLAGMYLSLEALGVPLDVTKAYQLSIPR